MKRYILLFISLSLSINAKNVIWDLGSILIDVNKFGVARSIGLSRFLLHMLLDRKNPAQVKAKAFSILRTIKNDSKQELFCTQTYPDLLQDLMANNITSPQLIEQCKNKIKLLAEEDIEKIDTEKTFCSHYEQDLTEAALIAMFDPITLANNTYIIEPVFQILQECASAVDENGKPRNQLFIISNYASDAYDELIRLGRCNAIFDLIPEENRVISGKIGIAKPDVAIYKYLLNTHQLIAEDSIFIDDIRANIDSAVDSGMQGIHLPTQDAAYLRECLTLLGAL